MQKPLAHAPVGDKGAALLAAVDIVAGAVRA